MGPTTVAREVGLLCDSRAIWESPGFKSQVDLNAGWLQGEKNSGQDPGFLSLPLVSSHEKKKYTSKYNLTEYEERLKDSD